MIANIAIDSTEKLAAICSCLLTVWYPICRGEA